MRVCTLEFGLKWERLTQRVFPAPVSLHNAAMLSTLSSACALHTNLVLHEEHSETIYTECVRIESLQACKTHL